MRSMTSKMRRGSGSRCGIRQAWAIYCGVGFGIGVVVVNIVGGLVGGFGDGSRDFWSGLGFWGILCLKMGD